MLVVELSRKTLKELDKQTKFRGSLKLVEEGSGVHRTTIHRIKLTGTATDEVAEKLEKYLFPAKKTRRANAQTEGA
jgi:hypothetical protein